MESIKGKSALVTGASSGIGLAITELLLQTPLHVETTGIQIRSVDQIG